MAIQPLPAHGTLNWDIPLNSILTQLGNAWYPSDYGWLSWTADPSLVAGNTVLPNGEIQTIGVWLRQAATVSNVSLAILTPGATLTAGQNFAGLYDSAGTRVGITADQSASWVSAGLKTMALTAPASLAAGKYYIAFVSNGGTRPAFIRDSGIGPINGSLPTADARAANVVGANTTLPASIVMGSRAPNMLSFWGALS